MKQKIKADKTFVTKDKRIMGKLMQLGHSFTQAVSEENAELVNSIIQEAKKLKSRCR